MENQTKIILGGAGALILTLALFLGLNYGDDTADDKSATVESGDIITATGIHWHPKLEIIVDGEQVEIPTGIGLTGGHDPMHTHESDGTVHLEYPSIVTEDGVRLGRFFEIWDKPFGPGEVLEYSKANGDTISFSVNEEELLDPVNYQFKDGETVTIKVQTK